MSRAIVLMRWFFVAVMGIVLASSLVGSLYAALPELPYDGGMNGYWVGYNYAYDGGFGASPIASNAVWWPDDPTIPFGPGLMPQWTSTPVINNSYSFSGTGGNTSTAQFGMGALIRSDLVANYIAPSTCLSQYAPDHGNTPATLTLDFEAVGEAHGYTPGSWRNVLGWYNLPLTATVANDGYVDILLNATFFGWTRDSSDNYVTVFNKTITAEWTKTTSGTEQKTLSDSFTLGDLIPNTTNLSMADLWNGSYGVTVSGTLTITVKNDDGPVSLTMPDGLIFGSQSESASAPEPSTLGLLLSVLPVTIGWWRKRKAT
jgi:hypothetical protein